MADEGLVRVPQERETPVQEVQRTGFGYCYAYSRSADSRAGGDRGQDFLLIRESTSRLVFALCDGVSQSFYGDLGARMLGEALVYWLWEQKPNSLEGLQRELEGYLNSLVPAASREVEKQAIPQNLPPMVRQVLEQKRDLGSESTFLAGVFDFKGGTLWLAWMGDSRLRLWGPEGEISHRLGETFHTQERWSSHRGCLGEVHAFRLPLREVNYLIAYSDGLARLDAILRRHFRAQSINAIIEDALLRPESDDISYFECWLGRKRPSEKAPLPSPADAHLEVANGLLKVRWRPVAGAARYEVQLDDGQTFDVFSPARSCEIPKTALHHTLRSLRVRAWDEEPGEWSQKIPIPAEVLPSPPPPPAEPETTVLTISSYAQPPREQHSTKIAVRSPQPLLPSALLAGWITVLCTSLFLFVITQIPGMPLYSLFHPSPTAPPTTLPPKPLSTTIVPLSPSLEVATETPITEHLSEPSPFPSSTPTLIPNPPQLRLCVKVNSGANVRIAPSKDAQNVSITLKKGDCLSFDAYASTSDKTNREWLRIAPNQPGFEQIGGYWISANLLKSPTGEKWENILPLVTLTPTPTPPLSPSPPSSGLSSPAQTQSPAPEVTVSPTR